MYVNAYAYIYVYVYTMHIINKLVINKKLQEKIKTIKIIVRKEIRNRKEKENNISIICAIRRIISFASGKTLNVKILKHNTCLLQGLYILS